MAQDKTGGIVALAHRELGDRFFYAEGSSERLFTENETNTQRLSGTPNSSPYVKDSIDSYIVHGKKTRSIRRRRGPKFGPLPAHAGDRESRTIRLRLSGSPVKDAKKALGEQFGKSYESVFHPA